MSAPTEQQEMAAIQLQLLDLFKDNPRFARRVGQMRTIGRNQRAIELFRCAMKEIEALKKENSIK